jgi:hypothetical protein
MTRVLQGADFGGFFRSAEESDLERLLFPDLKGILSAETCLAGK